MLIVCMVTRLLNVSFLSAGSGPQLVAQEIPGNFGSLTLANSHLDLLDLAAAHDLDRRRFTNPVAAQ